VIAILNVSKKFRIWEDRSRDLKETAINWVRGKKRSYREVLALRKINLEIGKGETVAFVGENGSGKSTLLKLLGGIYAPDEGKIVATGKISTLLELGVGFHPDLTGEENVYLNGAMLGFDRKEMRRRFDEIVSFSEIGDFIYSPIRTYSSGMLMRLGFSIATCVDPDILLIDEIFAVGDEAFQNKCFGRLKAFKTSGKTIVLVSHSMEMVQKFCERAILLHEGRVVCDDVPEKTVETYHAVLYGREYSPVHRGDDLEVDEILSEPVHPAFIPSEDQNESGEKTEEAWESATEDRREDTTQEGNLEAPGPEYPRYRRHGTFEAEMTQVIIKSFEHEKEMDSFISGELVSICLRIRVHRDVEDPCVGMAILRQEDGKMIVVYTTNTIWRKMNLGFLRRTTDIEIEFIQRVSLPEGEYYLTAAIANSDVSVFYDWQENLKSFQIKKGGSHWEGTVDLNTQIIIHK
jgi:ABC-type polysaccharide/polyol phosphate transport system ATPase subunit